MSVLKTRKLVVATNNAGKLREFERMLSPLGFTVVSQREVCPGLEVEETGTTFLENARLKAQAVHRLCGLASVADDSGLCVDYLNGAPGVYSARYAGENATDGQRVEKLLKALADAGEKERDAQFVSAICCVLEDGSELCCEGICKGYIGYEPRGEGGFGYDPIFYVGEKSFSEMTDQEKDTVSHRGKALREFVARIEKLQVGEKTSLI